MSDKEKVDYTKDILDVNMRIDTQAFKKLNKDELFEIMNVFAALKCDKCDNNDHEHEHTDEQLIQAAKEMILEALECYTEQPGEMLITKLTIDAEKRKPTISFILKSLRGNEEPYYIANDQEFEFGVPFELE